MRLIPLIFLLLGPLYSSAQSFNWPLKEAVKMPRPVVIQLKTYLEKYENYPVMPEKFTQLPTFNVLRPNQREFVDGIYYFFSSSHDTGNLFINRKGKVTVLANRSTAGILTAYATYLKQNPLPETKELEYLSAISAFLKHQYTSHKELVESGSCKS